MESLDIESTYNPVEATIHLLRYRFAQECGPKGRLLDIACGYGYGTHWLARIDGVTETVGVDRDPEALEAARRHSSTDTTTFCQVDFADLESLKALGTFDTIVCIETIEHAAQPANLIRALKDQWSGRGPFIISVPNDPFYYGPGRSLNPYHLSSKTWIASRNWLEEELGEGQWYLGTGASGFSIHRINARRATATYAKALSNSTTPLAGSVLPADRHRPLLPWNSLFYVGVWRGPKGVVDIATLFPAASDYRLPQFFTAPKSIQAGFRPRLLLVADIPEWAYDNIAKQVRMALEDRFAIEIAYQTDFDSDWLKSLYFYLWESQAEFIHFFWRETILRFLSNVERMSAFCERFNVSYEELAEKLTKTVITASVYDHLFLEDDVSSGRITSLSLLDGLSVSSLRLAHEYAAHLPSIDPTVLQDGVDLDVFQPDRLERFTQPARELVVGWVGNSTWNAKDGRDPKGFNTILRPAIEHLIDEGIPITGHFADRNVQWRPRSEMPEYYAEIDVLVCVSEAEGTPNPVLEAIACGVPVVSTDVGIVRDVMGSAQKKFILPERTPEALIQKLRYLHNHRDELQLLSKENLSQRHALAWAKQMPIWLRFFRNAEIRNQQFLTIKRLLIGTAIKERERAKDLNRRLQKKRAQADKANETVKSLRDAAKKKDNTINQLRSALDARNVRRWGIPRALRRAKR